MSKGIRRYTVGALSILAVLLLLASVALAQGSSGYDLTWWTVDGGGATPANGKGYSLGGTVGQPDAAKWTGDGYTLVGGFWGGVRVEYPIYLPLVLRNT